MKIKLKRESLFELMKRREELCEALLKCVPCVHGHIRIMKMRTKSGKVRRLYFLRYRDEGTIQCVNFRPGLRKQIKSLIDRQGRALKILRDISRNEMAQLRRLSEGRWEQLVETRQREKDAAAAEPLKVKTKWQMINDDD